MSLRFTSSAAVCATLVFCSGAALAQSISVGAVSVDRGDTLNKARQQEQPKSINYADCVQDLKYSIFLTVKNPAGYRLEVWASFAKDCSNDDARTNQTNPQCGVVYRETTARQGTILVSVRNIVAALHKLGGSDVPMPSCDICNTYANQQLPPAAFTLDFLLMGGDPASLPANEAPGRWPSNDNTDDTIGNIDLSGPAPPNVFSVGDGEALPLSWKYKDPAAPDKDLLGYRFFCVPKVGTATAGPSQTSCTGGVGGAAGASASGSSGASAGGSSGASAGGSSGAGTGTAGSTAAGATSSAGGSTSGNSDCPSSVLVQGEIPDTTYQCGSKLGAVATSANITGVSSGTAYAVGVAGFDKVGNVGKLSQIECGTPVLVTDFFEAYRDAGGTGGGGFCSFSPGHASRFGGAAGLLTACIALLARRRRR